MPEKRLEKRLQIPLSPEAIDVIGRLAFEMKCGKAEVCKQMLTESLPAMEQLTIALKKMRTDVDGGKGVNVRQLVNELEQAVGEAKQASLDLEQKMS